MPDKWSIDEVIDNKDDGNIWLDLSQNQDIDNPTTDDIVRQILEKVGLDLNKVTNIYLYACKLITNEALRLISEKCSQLENLDVNDCVNVTDEGIRRILQSNPNIKVLRFSICKKVKEDILSNIVAHTPNVTRINANRVGWSVIPDDIDFGKLNKLGDFDLRYNEIRKLPKSMANLPNNCKIYIGNNPLESPPIEMAVDGNVMTPATIASFYGLIVEDEEETGQQQQQGGKHNNANGGVGDSPDLDPDRLGRYVYAEAISEVTRAIESRNNSICVGLYGRWGSGKTFLYNLIQKVDAAYTNQQNQERLKELKNRDKKLHIKCNECSLQFTCNVINLLVCCLPHHSNAVPNPRAKSIATVFVLLSPIWICLYLVSLPFSIIKEIFSIIKKCFKSKKICCPSECCGSKNQHPSRESESLIPKKTKGDFALSEGDHRSLEGYSALSEGDHRSPEGDHRSPEGDHRSPEGDHRSPEGDHRSHDKPSWRDIKGVLTGDTAIYSNEETWSCLDTFQLLVLSSTQTFFKLIEFILSNVFTNFSSSKSFKRDDKARKSLYLICNAWLYNGTDLLWASLLDEMWLKVEDEFGRWKVRFHRFTIEISGESKTDDVWVKQRKRSIAVLKFVLGLIFYLVLVIALTVVITVYNVTIEEFAGNIYRKYILNIALYASPVILFLKDTRKLYLQLAKSKGTWIFEQAQSLENHQRADLSKKTGFMGIVKSEVGYFIDFLQTQYIIDWKYQLQRLARLFIFVDDLDRCDPQTIMNVLQAIMLLLLVDAPITCILAIDSNFIVASIEMHLGEKFRREGIDGYIFLDKIVQVPFCIPDLDVRRKTKFLQRLFEKKELVPLRLCQRLKHWGADKKYPEFKNLVPFEELDETKPPKEEEMIQKLAKVLETMIEMQDILKHNDKDAEACISSPKDVHRRVNDKVTSRQPLGDQLEEEFLSYVSSGIQEILSHKSNPSSKDATVLPSVKDTPEDEVVPAIEVVDNELPTTTPEPPEPESTSSVEMVADEDKIYHPMMDNEESEWFEKYADHMVGQPRKMKRITNSYMVSRIIAKKLSPKLASSEGGDFRRKLMKMIILFEQWPYRMAWLMVIVQNVQQELTLKKERNRENGNPIGMNLTSIISKLFQKEKEEEIMALPLIDVYYQLVQTLIHSPENATLELKRDSDPQIFEILLAESDALLKVKDIASISCGSSSGSLRPYVFNLQMHMLDKVEHYIDNCMVHTGKEDEQLKFGVFQQKKIFFDQNYSTQPQATPTTGTSTGTTTSDPSPPQAPPTTGTTTGTAASSGADE